MSDLVRLAVIEKSLPPRGAWIEITPCIYRKNRDKSLPPRGAWIEINGEPMEVVYLAGRSPHGERGLKSFCPKVR